MITTDQANTIVQLTEEDSKRAADALIKSYGSMRNIDKVALVAVAGALVSYTAYCIISDIVSRRNWKKCMREAHDRAVCGEDTNA